MADVSDAVSANSVKAHSNASPLFPFTFCLSATFERTIQTSEQTGLHGRGQRLHAIRYVVGPPWLILLMRQDATGRYCVYTEHNALTHCYDTAPVGNRELSCNTLATLTQFHLYMHPFSLYSPYHPHNTLQ